MRHLFGAMALLAAMGAANAATLEQRRAAFDGLLKEQWEYTLRTNPEFATRLGDSRFNDRMSDYSLAAIEAERKANADFLRRFQAVDSKGFPEQEKLSRDLMVRDLKLDLEGLRFKAWEMPMLQNSGIHLSLPRLPTYVPLATVKDYENYIARLHQVPRLMEQTRLRMEQGIKDKRLPPQFLIGAIAGQCRDLGGKAPEASPFAAPIAKMPATFSDADKARLKAALLDAIQKDVGPAYLAMGEFVEKRYQPHGRKEVGMWSLPDGAANYAFAAKKSTTTRMSPEQIHQVGLAEVARIEAQMLAIAKDLGYADMKSFKDHMEKNAALHPTSRQQMLDLYNKYNDQMQPKLPALFGHLPRAPMVVEAMETFREEGGPAAQYERGTLDGSRPGKIIINTGSFEKRLTVSIETTALHEGVPGHHLERSLTMELQGLPPFRTNGGLVAYSEGWALYSERLGEELGFFTDPYSRFGHLQDEMLRAIRLVVDTGLHYKKWSRQQVVDYFHDHSAFDEVEVQSETDRYIVWPGQALGYKIGQLKILELREYAKQQLGAKFDLRAFHDQVLGAGALPMEILEARIKSWVAAQKKGDVHA